MTRLLMRTFSITPPRPRVDLMRMPLSVPSNTQLSTTMFFTPPDISLPIDRPCPWSNVQLTMVQFSIGFPTRRPSASRPDLMVMQSSPTSIRQSEMCTLRQESGLMPSVFGEVAGLMIVDAVHVHVLAIEWRDVPERRVADGDAVDEHVRAFIQLDERRTEIADIERGVVHLGDNVLVQAGKFLLPLAAG